MKKIFFLVLLSSTLFSNPIKPVKQRYDAVLILGVTATFMKKRMEYLKKLWNDDVVFSKIVWFWTRLLYF